MPFNPKCKDLFFARAFIQYPKFPPHYGELDLILIDLNNKSLYIFEEKTSDTFLTRRKAKQQLIRARDYFSKILENQYTIRTYFLCDMKVDEYYPHTDRWDSSEVKEC